MPEKLPQRKLTDESLNRIQNFDPETLDNMDATMDFVEVIKPARKIIDMFKWFQSDVLDDFTDKQLSEIQGQADNVLHFFDQILRFDSRNSKAEDKFKLIGRVKPLYSEVFQSLLPLICYGVIKVRDFSHYEEKMNSILQQFTDRADDIVKQLEDNRKNAEVILSGMHKNAGELSVSEQAVYFGKDANIHQAEATMWRWLTIGAAALLTAWALFSPGIFNFFYPELVQSNDAITPSAIQVMTSKILVFTALGYLLILCGKTYLSHQHNAVVNKHRQNALCTYTTLVKAASTDENADIILNHAANCIFSPQDSGYVSSGDKNINLPPIKTIRQMSGDTE